MRTFRMADDFKTVVVALSACFLLGACGESNDQGDSGSGSSDAATETQEFSSDYMVYQSAEELFAHADGVVQGEVVSSRVHEITPEVDSRHDDPSHPQHGLDDETVEEFVEANSLVVTVYTLEVTLETTPGTSVGDHVDVAFSGGHLDGVEYVWEGQPDLSEGDEYLLVLYQQDETEPASLLNPTQSVYRPSDASQYVPVADEDGIPTFTVDTSDVAGFLDAE